MRLLVSTTQTQGQRKNDFNHVPDGEIVLLSGHECDDDGPDGSCGCMRSFMGVESHVGTTTAIIAEVATTNTELYAKVEQSYIKSGYKDFITDKDIKETVKGLVRLGKAFELGRVVEKRGDVYQTRAIK